MYRAYKVYVQVNQGNESSAGQSKPLPPLGNKSADAIGRTGLAPIANEKAALPDIASKPASLEPVPNKTKVTHAAPETSSENGDSVPTVNAQSKEEEERKKKEWKEKQLKDLEALKKQADDLKKMLLEQMAKVGPAKPLPKKTLLLHGNLETDYPSSSKLVRIFTSSTFTDTMHERNALMERVYPKLKQHCKSRGYDFQVVDMRWGVRDEATNDHMTTELCLQEIEACKKLSTGPSFVTFLSHKYGHRPLQRVIADAEFNKLLAIVDKDEEKALLEKWYLLDKNAVPPSRILQPISTHIPDYILIKDRRDERFKAANNEWWETYKRISDILSNAAMKALPEDRAHEYIISVTEKEVRQGLLTDDQKEKNCMWFQRTIRDIDQQEQTKLVSKFKDLKDGNQSTSRSSDSLLSNLKETVIKALPGDHIKSHDVAWTETGIDPEKSDEHKKYIDALCVEFEASIRETIDKAIEESSKNELSEELSEEIAQHIAFCKEKCGAFHGRKDVLETIKKAMMTQSKVPYIIHGSSGCGKTSLMAKVAFSLKQWLLKDTVLALRFLGTTPDSSNLRQTLQSISKQICKAYNVPASPRAEQLDLRLTIGYFILTLKRASQKPLAKVKPIVIILDSLDQLSNEGNPQGLTWIPKELPPNVYMILSTLPDTKEHTYGYLPKLQTMFKEQLETRFLAVPEIPIEDAKEIVTSWLEKGNRKLTDDQFNLVIKTYENCKLPLFLKLCFDEAFKWASFTQVDDTFLADNIQGAISAMFENMERKHGQILAARTFAYITASQNGLSEIELEDILSCDDDVLNDVYQYWTPPVRRLPPLLFVRLKADVNQYLVERGSGGITVIYWYHRQFIETANHRYLEGDHIAASERRLIHQNIADYFLEKWAYNKEKPFTSKTGESQSKCRFITPQPMKMKDQYNIRKLMELPVHLVLADRFTEFNDYIMMNLEWHLTKIKAFSFRTLMEDLDFALDRMSSRDHDVEEWILMRDMLRLSEEAVTSNPDLLPSQVFGRIGKGLDAYKHQCMQQGGYMLIPSTPFLTSPGGELVYCLAGHTKDMSHCLMTQDDQYAVTANEDNSIRVWDIWKGTEERMIAGPAIKSSQGITGLHLCCSDKYIVAVFDMKVEGKKASGMNIFDTKTGLQLLTKVYLNIHKSVTVLENQSHLALAVVKNIALFDVEKREFSSDKMTAPFITQHGMVYMSGAKNVLCAATDDRFLYIYDMETRKQIHCIEVAPKPENEDDDEYMADEVAVTPSGEKVGVLSIMDSVLHVFDTKTGQRLTKIEGSSEDTINNSYFISESLFLSCDLNSSSVLLWDIDLNERYHFFKHTETPEKICVSKDLKRFVTITTESVVRVWQSKEDVRIKYRKPEVIEKAAGNFNKERIMGLYPLPAAARYVLMHTRLTKEENEKNTSYDCLKIYDVHDSKAVRTIYLSNTLSTLHVISQNSLIALDSNYKLHIVDMNEMVIVRTYQGFAGSRDFRISEPAKDIFCLSKYCFNLKMLDYETGKTKSIIKTGVERQLSSFTVNETGLKAVVEVDDDNICYLLVIDLLSQQVLHELRLKGLDYLTMSDDFISKDGRYFTVNVFHDVPDVPGWTSTYFPVWDLNDGTILHYLYDRDHTAIAKFKEDKKNKAALDGLDVDSCHVYETANGDIKLVTGCSDFSLKAYDVKSGTLESTIPNAHVKSLVDVDHNMDTPEEKGKYCFSFSNEDHSLCIINNEDWSKVTSFKMDGDMSVFKMLDNYTLVCGNDSETPGVHANVLVLRLYNGVQTGAPPPHVYSANETEVNLDLPEVNKDTLEEGDPDADVKPPESDVEESDEDDYKDSEPET